MALPIGAFSFGDGIRDVKLGMAPCQMIALIAENEVFRCIHAVK